MKEHTPVAFVYGPDKRDRGFTLSDHVDWPQLLSAIDATGAERVFVTHGFSEIVVRWLQERGIESHVLKTRYEGEQNDAPAEPADANTAEAPDENRAVVGDTE